MQACDQARATPEASRRLRRHPQGGVRQVEEESEEGAKARRQEMVLHSLARVWSAGLQAGKQSGK